LLVVVGCCWLLLVVVGCCWLLLPTLRSGKMLRERPRVLEIWKTGEMEVWSSRRSFKTDRYDRWGIFRNFSPHPGMPIYIAFGQYSSRQKDRQTDRQTTPGRLTDTLRQRHRKEADKDRQSTPDRQSTDRRETNRAHTDRS
jgi:hypothetical protein